MTVGTFGAMPRTRVYAHDEDRDDIIHTTHICIHAQCGGVCLRAILCSPRSALAYACQAVCSECVADLCVCVCVFGVGIGRTVRLLCVHNHHKTQARERTRVCHRHDSGWRATLT